MMRQKELYELEKFGATCITMNKSRSEDCLGLCYALKFSNHQVCGDSQMRDCSNVLSCEKDCKCWINVKCDRKEEIVAALKELKKNPKPGGVDYGELSETEKDQSVQPPMKQRKKFIQSLIRSSSERKGAIVSGIDHLEGETALGADYHEEFGEDYKDDLNDSEEMTPKKLRK